MDKLFAEAKLRKIPTGLINGNLGLQFEEDGFSSPDSDAEESTTVYEQDYVSKEMKKYANFTALPLDQDDDDDGLSCVDGVDFPRQSVGEIYKAHNFTSKFTKPELAIDSFKNEILKVLNTYNVLIIQGDTGCGKTTQVPQYILDEYRQKNEYCKIVITQPRKIAAINVARRVCEERGWALGTVCGYQIGLEKKVGHDSLITYMTTGVLLQKLIMQKSLHEYSHIIIDEVHERNQDLDFLLLIIRKFLFTNSPHTKVILMSATIVARDFAYYFRSQNNDGEAMLAPIFTIDKKNVFTKQVFYADQLSLKNIPLVERTRPEINDMMFQIFKYILMAFDKIDVRDPVTKERRVGSVLVFLPGIYEIEEASKMLNQFNRTGPDDIKWDIIPLHSSLPNDEQAKVFKTPRAGYRKIILSTNIAESSITVPDIYFVVDFCLTKVLVVDPLTKYSSLQLEWASHVNCEQRAGRVGRVDNGRVYRMVPAKFYESMDKTSVPEILRAPLESVVLKSKMLNVHDTPKQILALSMNPPNLKNIDWTILNLKEVGGLLQTCRGVRSTSDGDLTFLGTVMASMPLDVRLSKLIVLGYMFSCLEEAIIIAAGCSIQNIFSIPFQQRFLAYKKLLLWSDGSCSDAITLLTLYNVWNSFQRENRFQNMSEAVAWCRKNYVSFKGMKEWTLLISEIKSRLNSFNIVDTGGQRRRNLTETEKPTVLKVIMCGAFYPNYFIRSSECHRENEEKEHVRAVGGRNPLRTVYLTGFDNQQPGALYAKQIKKMFSDGHNEQNINVGFDGSCKVYVEFKQKPIDDFLTVKENGRSAIVTLPGNIPMQMYECIRKRQLKYEFNLKLLSKDEAFKLAEKYGLNQASALPSLIDPNEKNCFTPIDYNPIPTLDVEFISIHITSNIDAGHFWCQHTNEETRNLGMIIERELNRQVLHPAIATCEEFHKLNNANIYAARWSTDNKFYRCKISAASGKYAYVSFIDYGNVEKIPVDQIYDVPKNIPELNTAPLAVECVLKGIKPAAQTNPQGVWSVRANNFFAEIVDNRVLTAKVYSVVDDTVHLIMFYKGRDRRDYCLNEVLIKEGFAVESKESYLSEENHVKRTLIQSTDNPNQAAVLSMGKAERVCDESNNPSFTTLDDQYATVTQLKGPYSPLEMRLYGCVESSCNKRVDIESSSVNAVLLDSQASDSHSIMLVAGSVIQGQTGNNIKLRQTTLMPNIPGLPAVMAMLFCPTMEPKLIDDASRVASLLCGMGCHEVTEKPVHPSHDMTIVLDTILKADEIDEINNLRHLMNNCVKAMNSNYTNNNKIDQDTIFQAQRNIIQALFSIIYRNRTSVNRCDVKFANYWGKSVADAVVLEPEVYKEPEDIWPLLWFVKIHEPVSEQNEMISRNLEEILSMAKSHIPPKQVDCLLCSVTLYDVFEIRKHLISKEHKNNYQAYKESCCFDD
ncbi:unnamed protein product [Brassicogethes aeneus]|uniref:Probable ATP-dependent RNA helicase spindle-E n=1 Tax=Brassicogethes aeneus TaxID=1431903 RepID=A0A9P0AX83_BRAAE|nr:unnamed protein product [Brassicogethes aeneus]